MGSADISILPDDAITTEPVMYKNKAVVKQFKGTAEMLCIDTDVVTV